MAATDVCTIMVAASKCPQAGIFFCPILEEPKANFYGAAIGRRTRASLCMRVWRFGRPKSSFRG